MKTPKATREIGKKEAMTRAVVAESSDHRRVAEIVLETPKRAAAGGKGKRPVRGAGIVAIVFLFGVFGGHWQGDAWAGPLEPVPTTIRDILPNSDSGVVSKVRPGELCVRSQQGGAEVRYVDAPATIYEDEAGGTIARGAIAVGMRVTVVQFTALDGGRKRIDRMVVDRRTGGKTIAPTVIPG